jgi:hypothetical protein
MNAITKAISELYYRIPPELLNIVFAENAYSLQNGLSLDEVIMNKVIRPRVLVDCNLVGGIETNVLLDYCSITSLPNSEYIINVPKTLTNGKSIITALSLFTNVYGSTGYNFKGGNSNQLTTAGMTMMDNVGYTSIVHTSRLELIAENTVLVQDPAIPIVNGTMRCMVENSANLENISPRNYHVFANLVEYAVKAYCYNTFYVKLDKGYLYGGHELGVIKELIDNYSDMNTMYSEYLTTTWKKVAFMNNSNAMDRYLNSMIGNNI